jgi:tRNA(His) 5'-end guanylyltransferase
VGEMAINAVMKKKKIEDPYELAAVRAMARTALQLIEMNEIEDAMFIINDLRDIIRIYDVEDIEYIKKLKELGYL